MSGVLRPWRGAAALLLVVASCSFHVAVQAAPTLAATRPRVSLIGDSVAASIAASGPARGVLAGIDLAVDARVCRRTATTGCPWRGEVAPSVADVVGATPGDLGDAVVIVSGYNDDARRFRRDATGVLTQLAAQGVQRIVWLDLRVTPAMPAATQARHRAINATLASLDRASPLLRVASWNGYSAGRDAWFFDPIHLRSSGAVELARFVRAQLAGVSAGARASGAPATRVRCAPANAAGTRPGRPLTGTPPPAGTLSRPWRSTVLADTRASDGDPLRRPLGAGRELRVLVAGQAPAAQSAVRAVVRVTAVGACGPGRIDVGGCGLPAAMQLALEQAGTTTAMAAMPLGAFGRVCLRSNAQTDVRVELLAWAGPAPIPS